VKTQEPQIIPPPRPSQPVTKKTGIPLPSQKKTKEQQKPPPVSRDSGVGLLTKKTVSPSRRGVSKPRSPIAKDATPKPLVRGNSQLKQGEKDVRSKEHKAPSEHQKVRPQGKIKKSGSVSQLTSRRMSRDISGANTIIDLSTQPADDPDVSFSVTADMDITVATIADAAKIIQHNDDYSEIDLGEGGHFGF
jgi:hypothetical protein